MPWKDKKKQRAYGRLWYQRHKKKLRARASRYNAKYIKGSSKATYLNSGDVGEAGELFVAVDLLTKGLEVTKPLNRSTKDDLHARFARIGWRNIQVKVAKVNKKTGTIRMTRSTPITSDIIAWVDLGGLRIRYTANTKEPLPEELK